MNSHIAQTSIERSEPEKAACLEDLLLPGPAPIEYEGTEVPFYCPAVLRQRAADEERRRPRPLKRATLRLIRSSGELHIIFESDKSIGNLCHRLDSYLWTRERQPELKATRLHFEDLGVKRRNGFLVRAVRHGYSVFTSKRVYELGSFTFLIPCGCPVMNSEFHEDPLHKPWTTPSGHIVDSPRDLVQWARRVNQLVVMIGGNPMIVNRFYHNNQLHWKEAPTEMTPR
jgi:hypothetical protein